MALTNQEQIQIDDIDSRVSINTGSISKNQADIQGIDNQNYLKLVKRSFVYTGCEIAKSGSDLSISLSKGSDAKSIAFVEGKYIEVLDNIAFIPANTSGSTRIDLIYLSREGGLLIKSGVAGSGLAPSLPSNSLEIYTLSIPTATTVNLSSCTLLDRRINVNSGHYLPTVGVALNESFLLTQQDGPNLAGLYYWDGSWNLLSSGGLVANYYTKDSVDILSSAMTEAEFRSRQNENKKNRDGSGYIQRASINSSALAFINGMMALQSSSVDPNTFCINTIDFTSFTDKKDLIVDMNGQNVVIKGFTANSLGYQNFVKLPEAPTDEKARQDLIGIEYWEEETDYIHPKGCTQSLATSLNGIATVVANFTGADTYSRFGTWQASGELVGRVVRFSTATVLQKIAMLSDPENCLFYNELGNLTQGKNRVRVIKGLTSNGAEWSHVLADTNNLAPSYNTLSYEAYNANVVTPKGFKSTITSDLNSAYLTSGRFKSYSATEQAQKGIFSISVDDTFDPNNFAYKGNCFFMPIAMVSRNRNQGGYHPEFNPMGTKQFSDSKPWNTTSVSITSISDCFVSGNLLTASGYISSGVSGRPDGLYCDEINQSDVRDLRLPTNYDKNVDTKLANTIKAERRGYENETTLVLESIVADSIYMGANRTRIVQNTTSLTNNNDNLGNLASTIGYIKLDDGSYYKINSIVTSGGKDYIDLSEVEGNQTENVTATNSYELIFWHDTDRFQNNTIQRCEIIGDPSNYTFSEHVGVANLVDVNTGDSQLPSDITTGAGVSAPKAKSFRLMSEYYTGAKVFVDGVEFTYGDPSVSLEYNIYGTLNKVRINWTDSYASLGYASEADMASNCVIEVFYTEYSNNFVPSVNEEVENRILSTTFDLQNSTANEGSKLLNDLLSKVAVSTSGTSSSRPLTKYLIYPVTRKIAPVNANLPETSHPTTLIGLADQPAIKVFLYQTNKDGLLYNVIVFKEMKFDGDWGDDQKFSIVDNIVTTTDDNMNTIIVGTVIDVNPVGFAKD